MACQVLPELLPSVNTLLSSQNVSLKYSMYLLQYLKHPIKFLTVLSRISLHGESTNEKAREWTQALDLDCLYCRLIVFAPFSFGVFLLAFSKLTSPDKTLPGFYFLSSTVPPYCLIMVCYLKPPLHASMSNPRAWSSQILLLSCHKKTTQGCNTADF